MQNENDSLHVVSDDDEYTKEQKAFMTKTKDQLILKLEEFLAKRKNITCNEVLNIIAHFSAHNFLLIFNQYPDKLTMDKLQVNIKEFLNHIESLINMNACDLDIIHDA